MSCSSLGGRLDKHDTLELLFGKCFKPCFSEGRSSGEAYIELETEEDITRVLEMDKSV